MASMAACWAAVVTASVSRQSPREFLVREFEEPREPVGELHLAGRTAADADQFRARDDAATHRAREVATFSRLRL